MEYANELQHSSSMYVDSANTIITEGGEGEEGLRKAKGEFEKFKQTGSHLKTIADKAKASLLAASAPPKSIINYPPVLPPQFVLSSLPFLSFLPFLSSLLLFSSLPSLSLFFSLSFCLFYVNN